MIHTFTDETLRRGIQHLSKDKKFKAVIKKAGPCPLRQQRQVHLFASLARAITAQQLSGKAAATIYKRFCALFPRKKPTADYFKTLTEQQLRSVGLSRNKILSLHDLAFHVIEKKLPSASKIKKMADQELSEKLDEVRGIGAWTAQMLLMFTLGRMDIFPPLDLGIQKGVQKLYGFKKLPTPQFLEKFSEQWKPYRSLAAWYLWRVVESADDDSWS